MRHAWDGVNENRDPSAASSQLLPVQELQECDSPVTCLCFGRQEPSSSYLLLAAATETGQIVLYRCRRTEMERARLLTGGQLPLPVTHPVASSQFKEDNAEVASFIEVHSRVNTRAGSLLSMFFSPSEEMLVTVSAESGVSFWSVDTGLLLRSFRDSAPVLSVAFLPHDDRHFVAGGATGTLRLIDGESGTSLQKLKVGAAITSIAISAKSGVLFAGSEIGALHVLSGVSEHALICRHETCVVDVEALTKLVLGAEDSERGVSRVFACAANAICLVELRCEVGVGLTSMRVEVLQRYILASPSPSNRCCCCCPLDSGWLVRGDSSGLLHLDSMSDEETALQPLRHHCAPLRALAANQQDTLLASADASGRIVLWRRLSFA